MNKALFEGCAAKLFGNIQWSVDGFTDFFKRRDLQTSQKFSVTSSCISSSRNEIILVQVRNHQARDIKYPISVDKKIL